MLISLSVGAALRARPHSWLVGVAVTPLRDALDDMRCALTLRLPHWDELSRFCVSAHVESLPFVTHFNHLLSVYLTPMSRAQRNLLGHPGLRGGIVGDGRIGTVGPGLAGTSGQMGLIGYSGICRCSLLWGLKSYLKFEGLDRAILDQSAVFSKIGGRRVA